MISNQNIHLLLPQTLLGELKRRAKKEKKSVGELIRRAVSQVYGSPEPADRMAAYERLSQHSELLMDDWSKVKVDLLRRYE